MLDQAGEWGGRGDGGRAEDAVTKIAIVVYVTVIAAGVVLRGGDARGVLTQAASACLLACARREE